MPRLVPDLDARFIRRKVRVETRRFVKPAVLAVKPHGPYSDEDCCGLMFLCPKCFVENGGPVGTHSVICWFVGRVPDEVDPKPGRWTPQGTSMSDLTFVPSAGRTQSVLLTGGCGWHGFVVDGSAS